MLQVERPSRGVGQRTEGLANVKGRKKRRKAGRKEEVFRGYNRQGKTSTEPKMETTKGIQLSTAGLHNLLITTKARPASTGTYICG